MKKSITLLLTLTTFLAFSQQKATTSDGKKVLLKDNGTWEYEKEEVNNDPLECSSLVKTTLDKVTGKTSTGFANGIIISKDNKIGVQFYALRSEETIIAIFQAIDVQNCIDQGSKINILFTDGSRMELKSKGKFNCDGDATVYFGEDWGTESEYKQLQTKKIDIIRIWKSKGYTEETLSDKQAEKVMRSFACMPLRF